MCKKMNITKNKFRLLVATTLSIMVVAIFDVFYSLSNLPPELVDFVNNQSSNSFGMFDTVFLLFGLLALVGNVGLLFFAKWSPFAYTVGFIFSSLDTLTYSPSIQTGLQATLYEVNIFLTGFIIALLYFSNVSSYFKNEKT